MYIGGNESGQLTVSLAVLGQHLVGLENIACPGGEITVFEESTLRHDLFRDGLKNDVIKEVQQNCHSKRPPVTFR